MSHVHTYLFSSWMQSKINTPDGATISNPHCEANLIMILCKSPWRNVRGRWIKIRNMYFCSKIILFGSVLFLSFNFKVHTKYITCFYGIRIWTLNTSDVKYHLLVNIHTVKNIIFFKGLMSCFLLASRCISENLWCCIIYSHNIVPTRKYIKTNSLESLYLFIGF